MNIVCKCIVYNESNWNLIVLNYHLTVVDVSENLQKIYRLAVILIDYQYEVV